tara:strand:+ start:866 stop:1048 length:183 start_codon:yes stop_codon:yes gene_type:complete
MNDKEKLIERWLKLAGLILETPQNLHENFIDDLEDELNDEFDLGGEDEDAGEDGAESDEG